MGLMRRPSHHRRSRAERKARAERREAQLARQWEVERQREQTAERLRSGMAPEARELAAKQRGQEQAAAESAAERAPRNNGKRPRCSHSKDLDRYVALAWDAGWPVERGGGDHIKVTAPSGKIISVPGTPSKQRTVGRLRSAFRREGLDV